MLRRPPSDPNDNLELARNALGDLKRSRDWNEVTPVVHVNVQRSPAPPAPPAPPPATQPETPGALASIAPRSSLQLVGAALKRSPPWGIILLGLAAIAAYVYLKTHGQAP